MLYDHETIDTLPWPNTPEGEYAKKYLPPFVKQGTRHFIDNINAKVYAMKVDDLVFPVVEAGGNFEDCYTCSTFGYYVSYALQSMHIIKNPTLRALTAQLLKGFGHLAKKGQLNSVIYVNNWLFSTDLYPEGLTAEHIKKMLAHLRVQFPRHAISFRSLNPLTTSKLKQEIGKLNFTEIATRQVYITDATNEAIFQTRILKSDLKLLRESGYEVLDETQLRSEDRSKLLSLYRTLYLDQHSTLNPQFNQNYMELAMDQGLLHIRAVRKNGSIDGVVGFYERSGVMMCPFLGYDKGHPQNTVIYRLLSTILLLEAKKRKVIFNQSAGASFYKKTRRAEGCIETMAVYIDHLPLSRRIPWMLLKNLINTIGIPAMKKY
jgi:hypothetical protein